MRFRASAALLLVALLALVPPVAAVACGPGPTPDVPVAATGAVLDAWAWADAYVAALYDQASLMTPLGPLDEVQDELEMARREIADGSRERVLAGAVRLVRALDVLAARGARIPLPVTSELRRAVRELGGGP